MWSATSRLASRYFLTSAGDIASDSPGVVEARLVGGIDGKLFRRADVHSRQIADGVVVLGVAQPPREDDAGIVRMALRFLHGQRLNPVDDGLALGLRRLLPRLAGRHLSRLEPREHERPAPLIAGDGIAGGIGRQIETGRGLAAAMAGVAIGGEEGLDAGLKDRVGRVCGPGGRRLAGRRHAQHCGSDHQGAGENDQASSHSDASSASPKVYGRISHDPQGIPHVGRAATSRRVRPDGTIRSGPSSKPRCGRTGSTAKGFFSIRRPATSSPTPRSRAKSRGPRSPRRTSASSGGGRCATACRRTRSAES